MKILHISNYFYPQVGGIEQVARDCIHALEGTAEQRLLCFTYGKKTVYDTVDGIEVVRAGTFAKVSSQSLSVSFGRLLRRTLREFRPDAVLFHFPNPFQAHYLLKALKKYPTCRLYVWWHLDIYKQKLLKKFFHGQTKRLLSRAEKVVATSPNYIEGSKYLSAFREKCVVIPNCAEASRVAVGEDDLLRAGQIKAQFADKTLLFALGRHVPYKGIEYLVRASRLLDDRFAVCIGGEGPLTPSLKALAEGDEKVRFLGKIDNDTCKAYMLACDIFCFPSITKNEAFGIALAEAMSLGKPAVTFRIEGSGVNYVNLAGETGLEVENGNVEAYAAAIETLAKDEALRAKYGEAARTRARTLFCESAFREKVRALMQTEN